MSAADDKTQAMSIESLEALETSFEPTRVGDHKRIGRYELVYELGTGGMASVYLARAAGPAGFNKWFAIKRIHPHLAKDRRFVDMFLDEARIAASLHHPNVAHVFDLGNERGEYFLAMEYLHGEHLGSVAVRAARELGRMPPELAAYIVARAADGLHHAHDAHGPDGKPLGLVHRDVSPQNLFIGYDGTIRITDFGIAKAAGRLTQTETGSTKGKCAYMAPEQALGTALDRRADLFALGIVLWELTVGRRLFKADSDAATLLRITSGRTPAPSQVVAGYPLELEQIVMRALAQRPEHRYATAAALARDLDRFVAMRGVPAGAAEVSAMMQRLFADHLRAKDELLRGEPGTTLDLPAPQGPREDSLPREQSHSDIVRRPSLPEAPRRASVVPWVLAGVIGILAATTGAWLVLGTEADATVRIDSQPSGARILVDGREVGFTPAVSSVDLGRHELRLELEGHAPFVARFDAEEGRTELSYRLAAGGLEVRAASPPQVALPLGLDPPAEVAVPAPALAPIPLVPEAVQPIRSPLPATGAVVAPLASPTKVASARESTSHPRASGPRAPERPQPPAPPGPPAYLNLITVPWASVTINGRSFGNTPLVRREVPAGPLTVVLRREGRGPARTLRLRASPGETVSQRLDLH